MVVEISGIVVTIVVLCGIGKSGIKEFVGLVVFCGG